MTTTKTTNPFATKFHRDGTVTIWNVYRQGWVRYAAAEVPDRIQATLDDAQRARIARMAASVCPDGYTPIERYGTWGVMDDSEQVFWPRKKANTARDAVRAMILGRGEWHQ
jgi:hypothetical protein